MALTDPSPPDFAPSWLAPASVKEWLRINEQDTEDDDLIRRACAMAEPYVERCRPEFWVTPAETVGAAVSGRWQVNPQPDAIPGGQQLTCSSGVLATADWLRFTPLDQSGTDFTLALLAAVTIGMQHAADADNRALFDVTAAATDYGTYVEIPVTFAQGSGAQSAAAWQTAIVALSSEPDPITPGYVPDAEAYQGGVMYAAREYRRRNSPAGIEMLGEVASFVTRYDTDIERALHTGNWAPPVIA